MGQPMLNIKNFFGMLTMGGNKAIPPDFCFEQQDMIANRGFCKTRPGFSRFDPTAQGVGSLGPLGLFQFRRKNGQWSTISFSDDGKMYDWPDWAWDMPMLGGFDWPHDIFYDSASEYIYVADANLDCIIKTKIDGTGYAKFGTSGWGVNQFSFPTGVYYDSASEYLYISDYGNSRLIKTKFDGTGWTEYTDSGGYSIERVHYDSASEFIYCATHSGGIIKVKIDGTGRIYYDGKAGDGFGGTKDVYYDSDSGYVYVADSASERIVKTKLDGSYTGWTTYGTSGSINPGEFTDPQSIYFDSASGYIYVTDGGDGRIIRTKIDGTGWEQIYFPNFSLIYPVHFDSASGYIYSGCEGLNSIFRVKF